MFKIGDQVEIQTVDEYGFQGREFHPQQTDVGRWGFILASHTEYIDAESYGEPPSKGECTQIVYYTVGLVGKYRMFEHLFESSQMVACIVNCVEFELRNRVRSPFDMSGDGFEPSQFFGAGD